MDQEGFRRPPDRLARLDRLRRRWQTARVQVCGLFCTWLPSSLLASDCSTTGMPACVAADYGDQARSIQSRHSGALCCSARSRRNAPVNTRHNPGPAPFGNRHQPRKIIKMPSVANAAMSAAKTSRIWRCLLRASVGKSEARTISNHRRGLSGW